MEVHRQQCQRCQSIDVRDIIVREEGRPQIVLVRCAQCGELVARYTLSDYYHHGKDIESFLRSHGGTAAESGRRLMEQFKQTREAAVADYERALDELKRQDKPV